MIILNWKKVKILGILTNITGAKVLLEKLFVKYSIHIYIDCVIQKIG